MATIWIGLAPMGRPTVLDRRAAGGTARDLGIASDTATAELLGGGR